MIVAPDLPAAIGNTPLIRLRRASELTGCEIWGKAEFMNPGQSVKDRPARQIILEAEKRGEIRPGGLVVEATAGNTGIGLALVANARGYRTLIVIPETQSQEKKDTLRALGAELVEVSVPSLEASIAPIVGLDELIIDGRQQNTAKEGRTASYSPLFDNDFLVVAVPRSPGLMTPAAGYTFAWEGWMVFVVIFLACLEGITDPALRAITAAGVPPSQQGDLQGTLTSLSSVTSIVSFGASTGSGRVPSSHQS